MEQTIPIIRLLGGEVITPRVSIDDARVRHWKYRSECAPLFGTLIPGAQLEVVETSKQPGQMWVRVKIPGRSPDAFLKVSGEEYSAAFRLLATAPTVSRTPELTYNIVAERLVGSIDGVRIDASAGSGGRAGSKVPGATNWQLQNNPLATHVGGAKSRGTDHFGPIPTGTYTLKVHESRPNWIRLVPDAGNVMFGREGFAIHGRGQVGSHGCIVPTEPNVILQLISILRTRESRHAPAARLAVVAIGSDVDKKFRTV